MTRGGGWGRGAILLWVVVASGGNAGAQARAPARDSTWWVPKPSEGSPARRAGNVEDVVDVARDSVGRIYLADAGRRAVLVLDARLRVMGTLGRPGSATGEYRAPRAVRIGGRDTVYALDELMHRVYVYRWVAGRPELVRQVSLPFPVSDFCPQPSGGMLVLGYHARHRLHAISPAGRLLASAAPFRPPQSPMLEDYLTPGRLACLPNARYVVTSESVPRVERFEGPTVQALVRSGVDSVWPVRKIEFATGRTPGGQPSMTFSAVPEGYHMPGRASATARGLVISARVDGRGDRQADDSLRVFELDGGRVTRRWQLVGRLFALGGEEVLHVAPSGGTRLARWTHLPK
ncbi:MAG: hypothetical protein IT360_27290 [Gemmatimonadaceae bacterium]|nr:hypothetical protein [Gemmatimonadaceae bacterium]